MSIGVVLALVAVILAAVDQFQADGKSLTDWAVIFLAIGVVLLAGGVSLG